MNELKKSFITTRKTYQEGEVYLFKQTFHLTSIKSATLYATALGIYEISCNNQKIGDALFSPGFTYYPLQLNYQSYDMTHMLKSGENTIDAYLGQGWYAGRFTHENKTQIYGDLPAISWLIKIIDENHEEIIITSLNHVYEYTNEYEYAGFYDGEIVNRNRLKQSLGEAIQFQGKIPEIVTKSIIHTKIQETIEPVEVIENERGYILDFGQNFAGFVTINPALMSHESVFLEHGEILDQNKKLYTNNLRKAKAQIKFTKDDSSYMYKPRFTYMGFRYVQLSGTEYKKGLIKAHVIHTEMKRTGYFESSNTAIKRLFDNQLWGQKSNYIDVPTDCPQRDERMGYTGDGQVFALTGAFNYDTRLFWKKYLRDIYYTQLENSEGYVAPTVPANGPGGIGYLSMLGWGNCVTIVPKMLYEQYGDITFLSDQYDSIKKHINAEIRYLDDQGLWLQPSLGDWLAPGRDMVWSAMNHGPVSNAFIVNDLKIISWFAKTKSYEEDYTYYSDYLKFVKNGYIKAFINENGTMKQDAQGAYVMALQYVLDDSDLRNKVMKAFVNHVRNNGLQTGFFGTQFLLPLLIEAKETKLAYDLLFNDQYPSWLYQVKHGATTIWERWDAILEDGTINDKKVSKDNMVSFNHFAFGSVGQFYYQYILGIKPLEPGYEKIQIQPFPDVRLGHVKGSFDAISGTIKVSWFIKEKTFILDIDVPKETVVILPDQTTTVVLPGSYKFEAKL